MVEDDDAVRRMTRMFLEINGYAVVDARNAADAIQLMERHKGSIELVLTDVVVPGMKGRELIKRLVKLRAGWNVPPSGGVSLFPPSRAVSNRLGFRKEPKPLILKDWLGGLDSNQDSQIQNLKSCQLDDLPTFVGDDSGSHQ